MLLFKTLWHTGLGIVKDPTYLHMTELSKEQLIPLQLVWPRIRTTTIPKNSTCVKPSGTLSGLWTLPEGMHKPLSKYIFNNVVLEDTIL